MNTDQNNVIDIQSLENFTKKYLEFLDKRDTKKKWYYRIGIGSGITGLISCSVALLGMVSHILGAPLFLAELTVLPATFGALCGLLLHYMTNKKEQMDYFEYDLRRNKTSIMYHGLRYEGLQKSYMKEFFDRLLSKIKNNNIQNITDFEQRLLNGVVDYYVKNNKNYIENDKLLETINNLNETWIRIIVELERQAKKEQETAKATTIENNRDPNNRSKNKVDSQKPNIFSKIPPKTTAQIPKKSSRFKI